MTPLHSSMMIYFIFHDIRFANIRILNNKLFIKYSSDLSHVEEYLNIFSYLAESGIWLLVSFPQKTGQII